MPRDAELPELVALLRAEGRLVDNTALARAAVDLQRWRADGIDLIANGAASYPRGLSGISDAPELLFVSGELRPEDDAGIAIIGTRRPSLGGLRDAADCARLLAAQGRTVVSGLASGIDTAAHQAALDAGGRTVAVLGTGLAHTYPPENAGLQAHIATAGALVSQFWPEQRPARANFPTRNALMAALTRATVIVEAHETSGTRIQARYALAYGRRLILLERVLEQRWARDLAQRDEVHVITYASELTAALETDDRAAGQGDGR